MPQPGIRYLSKQSALMINDPLIAKKQLISGGGNQYGVEGVFEKKEGGKRTLSTKSVSSEEGDEASGGDKGRVGGKRTKSVSWKKQVKHQEETKGEKVEREHCQRSQSVRKEQKKLEGEDLETETYNLNFQQNCIHHHPSHVC